MDRWQLYGLGGPEVAPGWVLEEVTRPSRLAGSNGMALGPDGRLHVTQVFGSQVTAIDPETGDHELSAPLGSGIVGPDDAAFGADGTLFVTEPMVGRVSARHPDGRHRVVRDDLPGANGIALDHQRRRLFVDEFRRGGRLLELDPAGAARPRVLLEDLDGPNALAVGPDGRLYFPQVFAGEVWAYDLDSGRAARVAGDLDVPTAVRFDSQGRIVTSEAGGGRITAIDPGSGRREVLAEVPIGIDNCTVGPGDRLFVSHYVDGRVAEETGGRHRVLSPPGLLGPLGLALGGDGHLLVADALSVASVAPGGALARLLVLLVDLPGLALDVCRLAGEVAVLSSTGEVLRAAAGAGGRPEVVAGGLAAPSAMVPDGSGAVLVAEGGAGRITRVAPDGAATTVADGLQRPVALALGPAGELYVSQAGPGPVLLLGPDGGRRELGRFDQAQGLALADGALLVADVARRALVALDLASGRAEDVVSGAPVGPPAQGQLPVARCALCGDGAGGAYVGANGDGSIRRLRRA